jgi:ABC-type phosphate/phosphonate transport system substrate-binding protein
MNAEDLKEFLEANKAEIQAKVRERLIDGLLANHSWTMRYTITETVSTFMKEEIVPEVKKHLTSEKSAILEAAIASTAQIGEMITKAMVERAAKNISADSYSFRDVLSGLFK